MAAGLAEDLADELGRAVRRLGIGSQDVVFLPYANLVEVEGLALLRPVWRDGAPRTILLFRRELDEQGSDTRLGGRAVTGSFSRCRLRSAARLLAVSYRRLRSFSKHFITIQSKSPRNSRRSLSGSLLRCVEIVVAA